MGSDYHFEKNYADARDSFIIKVQQHHGKLSKEVICKDNKTDLTTDIGYFPPKEDKKTLYWIISGTHGVEGHAGSALQLNFLDTLVNKVDRTNNGVVLYHALNPFGMYHNRRVNENNADLNRSCFDKEDAPSTSHPEIFESVYQLLTPDMEISAIDDVLYILGSAWKIHKTGKGVTHSHNPIRNFKEGFSLIKKAIAGGQYHRPESLFYGATEQKSIEVFKKTLHTLSEGFENLVVLDIHTGLGERYDYVLWTSQERNTPQFSHMRNIEPRIEAGDDKNGSSSYIRRGDLNRYVLKHSKATNTYAMGVDFGTEEPQEITRIMVREHQAWRHPGSKYDDKARTEMTEAFFPSEEKWRKELMEKGTSLLERIGKEFNVFSG